jgi:hypothetical protein
MAAFDCFGGYQALQSVPWRTPTPVGVPLPLCSPAANQHNVFHMSSLRSKVELRIVHATGALLGGAMTQEGRIRRRFRQSRVATVELLIMVLLAGTLLGPCVRSTPESGSAARPRSTPEPDSGPTKAPTPEPDSGSTPSRRPRRPIRVARGSTRRSGFWRVAWSAIGRRARCGRANPRTSSYWFSGTVLKEIRKTFQARVRWWRRRKTLALLWLRSSLEGASRFSQQATSAECWAPTVLLNGIG